MHKPEAPKKYAAFISYRHVMPDMAVAQRLHKMLEHNQVRPNRHVPRNIRPVFLDTGELPTQESLDDSILRALDNSDCLFVICSPDLPKSKYCLREIEYFKEIHGGRTNRIYTILVRGTSSESFPESLLKETRVVQDEHGQEKTIEYAIEPLFANICAPTLRDSFKKLRKTEYLRLAAAYYGCSYDGLYKRRRRWQLKVGACCLMGILAIFAVFGVYAHVRNLQFDSARAATYASYAETQTAEGNELLAMVLCEEGKDSAQSSRSDRYMAALRSAVVQHDFKLRARPVALSMSADSERTDSPIFYLNDDGTLSLSMTDHFFQITDLKTGAILQQYSADSVAVDPDDMSVYVQVEAVRDENGQYQDTLFIRTLDGRLLSSAAFRETTIYTPQYKMVSERNAPDLLGMKDQNELVVQFTRQGQLLSPEEADALRNQEAPPALKEEAPYYVPATSIMNKTLRVKNKHGQTVLELDSKKGLTSFSSDYAMFCFVKDGLMTIYDTDEWTPIGQTQLPDGLLQKVYLLRDTGYALCIYQTTESFNRSMLVDWRTHDILLDAEGRAELVEDNSIFYCMERSRITGYSYHDMNTDSGSEITAMSGNRILSCSDKKIIMRDAASGKTLWSDTKEWWKEASYNQQLTRILIPGSDALRCRNETGAILWQAEIGNACSALSADGSLAAYLSPAGDVHVVSSSDGAIQYTISHTAFEQIGYPEGLFVSPLGVAILDIEQALWFPEGSGSGFELGAYSDAAEAGKYLILSNSKSYVMDFAVWDPGKRQIIWQPAENTGLWKWSEASGYLVRHKEVSGNHAVAELAVHRLTQDGVEDVCVIPLPERQVSALWLDSTGQWLSVRAGDSTLLYHLPTMEKALNVTLCPVFYENGRLWDWYTYEDACYSIPMLYGQELYARSSEALTSSYGVRTLSAEEQSLYSFSE